MSRPLRAGELNRQVVIEHEVLTPDGRGGRSKAWDALRTVYAKATPVAGKEGLINGNLRSQQGWRLELRFAADIGVKNQLRMGDQVIDIQSCQDPDGRRERLVIFGNGKPG